MESPSYHHQRFPGNCQLEFERCRKFFLRNRLIFYSRSLLEAPYRSRKASGVSTSRVGNTLKKSRGEVRDEDEDAGTQAYLKHHCPRP